MRHRGGASGSCATVLAGPLASGMAVISVGADRMARRGTASRALAGAVAGAGLPGGGRRRLLLAGASGLLLLAGGCGRVFDDDRLIVDDRDDGAEIRLWLGQELEIRLPIERRDGHVTFLRSRIRPVLRYRRGPDYRDHDPRRPGDDRPIESWLFRAQALGNTTIRLQYARHADAQPVRVLTYRVDVY